MYIITTDKELLVNYVTQQITMVTTYFASWYISHGRLEIMTRFRVCLVSQNGMNVRENVHQVGSISFKYNFSLHN